MWIAILAAAVGYLGYRIATAGGDGLQVFDPKVGAEILRNTTLYSVDAGASGASNVQLKPNVSPAGALAFVTAPTASGFDWVRNLGPGFTVLGPAAMWTETQPWKETTARLVARPIGSSDITSLAGVSAPSRRPSGRRDEPDWVVILKDTGKLAKFSGMDGEHVAKTLHANDLI